MEMKKEIKCPLCHSQAAFEVDSLKNKHIFCPICIDYKIDSYSERKVKEFSIFIREEFSSLAKNTRDEILLICEAEPESSTSNIRNLVTTINVRRNMQ